MEVTYNRSHSRAKFKGMVYCRHVRGEHIYFRSSKTTGYRRSLHRDVYSSHWGFIPEGFVVHHVDSDPYNNEEINLEAMSIATHMSIHQTGREVSEETKKKISVANMGNQNCLGRVLSEDHKRRISTANMGRVLSEEAKKKMSMAKMGKKNPSWKGDNDVTPQTLYMRKYRAAKKAEAG